MWQIFFAVLSRDLKVTLRHKSEWLAPFLFFLILNVLFSIALAGHVIQLQEIGSIVIWISILLATTLSIEQIFKNDDEEGTLDQLQLSPYPLSLILLAKAFAQWIAYAVPLLVFSPILAGLFHISAPAFLGLFLSLLIGTPALCLVGSMGVSLTLGLKRGGMLLTLLILPLYVPILILGMSCEQYARAGLPYSSLLALLAAIFIGSLMLMPFVVSLAMRYRS